MDPDDIPASITKLSETAPNVAMTDTRRAAWALAHFWPAIEQHIREQVADEIEKSEFQRGPISGSNHYVGGYTDGIADAARTARGEH